MAQQKSSWEKTFPLRKGVIEIDPEPIELSYSIGGLSDDKLQALYRDMVNRSFWLNPKDVVGELQQSDLEKRLDTLIVKCFGMQGEVVNGSALQGDAVLSRREHVTLTNKLRREWLPKLLRWNTNIQFVYRTPEGGATIRSGRTRELKPTHVRVTTLKGVRNFSLSRIRSVAPVKGGSADPSRARILTVTVDRLFFFGARVKLVATHLPQERAGALEGPPIGYHGGSSYSSETRSGDGPTTVANRVRSEVAWLFFDDFPCTMVLPYSLRISHE